jgi:hypothetical protein
VDFDNIIENDFLGVNAVYHGFAFMPEEVNKGMNDADRGREFDRVQRIGLNIARTWYRPDWACGNNIYNNFDWTSGKMTAFYNWLHAMKNRNVDVALNLGWWFSGDTSMDSSQNTTTDPKRYAEWVSESLHQIIEVRGYTNVRYGVLFTEPGYGGYYETVVRAIHNKLVTDGRRNLIKLVGPNNTDGGVGIDWAANTLNDVIDIYSGHGYNYSDYTAWFNMFQDMRSKVAFTGKPVWLDEWGMQWEAYRQGASYGKYMGQVVAASINAGVQTSLIWLLFDQQYPDPISTAANSDSFYNGVHRWGICKWPHDTVDNPTHPYPSWYAFSLLSKYLPGRKGTKVYQTANGNGVYISALKTQAGDYSFLVVNGNLFPGNISVNLNQSINKTLYRYLYDPVNIAPTEAATLIGYSKVFNNVGNNFTDTIPADALVIYSSLNGGVNPLHYVRR